MICYTKLTSCYIKKALKQHFEEYKTSTKHLIKIINFGAKNCPAGRNGLSPGQPEGKSEPVYDCRLWKEVCWLLFFLILRMEVEDNLN